MMLALFGLTALCVSSPWTVHAQVNYPTCDDCNDLANEGSYDEYEGDEVDDNFYGGEKRYYEDYDEETQYLMDRLEREDITKFLNPKLFEDPQTLANIGKKFRSGGLVVIRDAFDEDFAAAMYDDIDSITNWDHNVEANPDGFHFSHHNVYEQEERSDFADATNKMFEHPATTDFMTKLSGRDCSGGIENSGGSASYFMPGDHSLPHTDHCGQRTVAFVWHLTKDWRKEWGGALCRCLFLLCSINMDFS